LRSVLLAVTIAVAIAACGGGTATSTGSPTPNLVTKNYVALVHNYWIQYKTAEGDLDHIDGTSVAPFSSQDAARVCFGLASPTATQDLSLVIPTTCGRVAAAMVAVHEKFLGDLGSTPAPPKFAGDDKAFRTQLPKAIADIRAMIAVSASGDKQSVVEATAAYVSAMIPIVTDALNEVDPGVIHN
jgi:hypothetical protein